MNVLGWVTLAIGIFGGFFAAGKNISGKLAKLIIIATQLQEQVKLSLVGIETLKMIDQDTNNRIVTLERRVDDLERYTQITTANAEHPFVIRYQDKTNGR